MQTVSIFQYLDINELIQPVMQQTRMLAVKEARESAKSEQLTQMKVEEDTLPTLGTIPLIFPCTQCTKCMSVLTNELSTDLSNSFDTCMNTMINQAYFNNV